MPEISLVKIKTYRYLHEAQIAKTALESEGIESFIDSEYISTLNWAYSAPDGIGLRVNAEDVEEALEILSIEEKPDTTTPIEPKTKKHISLFLILVIATLIAIWFFSAF